MTIPHPPRVPRGLRLPHPDAVRAAVAEHDARATVLRRLLRLLLSLERQPGASCTPAVGPAARGGR